jgi:4-hydroxybenzoate polyprenyltransferase
MKKIRLTRPANIITSMADIFLGFAASGTAVRIFSKEEWTFFSSEFSNLYFLLASSACLYGGGVVFNDLFDYETDIAERPERPLPSGKANPDGAFFLGLILSFGGIFLAFCVSVISGLIAALILCLSLLYNKYLKDHLVFGPVNMAACRSANLLLGLSVVPEFAEEGLLILIIPFFYISAITHLSKGEVNGSEKKNIETSLLIYMLLLIFIFNLPVIDHFSFLNSFPFLLLFILFAFSGIIEALKNPEQPLLIRKTVKNSILGLILLDASLAAGFAGISFGIFIILLLPLSIGLSKIFAVS